MNKITTLIVILLSNTLIRYQSIIFFNTIIINSLVLTKYPSLTFKR